MNLQKKAASRTLSSEALDLISATWTTVAQQLEHGTSVIFQVQGRSTERRFLHSDLLAQVHGLRHCFICGHPAAAR